MNRYNAGSLIKMMGTFRDENDLMIDPDDVHILITHNGAPHTYHYGTDIQVEKLSSGTYQICLLSQLGFYIYKFYSTGTIAAASEEGEFFAE
jgi:hypothetical protein